ncbi:hypothetical protein E3N88_30230 [Mikania micrantha]|uniref:Uncharacterized protein n=1 Tax=Mikania micrantha TaxID=192012 RepID=A0A5N6MN65_9ASTR|nr:hypothetical protein E3N88_30230 [Mikania micrantha]
MAQVCISAPDLDMGLVNSALHIPARCDSQVHLGHKSIYQIIFGKDKVKKLLAERRIVLRIESQIHEHTRKLHTNEVELEDENVKIKAAIDELKRLRTVKEASTALKVWQPEIIHTRQKQIVENCCVPVDFRINALEMEIKLCKQHISGFLKTWERKTKGLKQRRNGCPWSNIILCRVLMLRMNQETVEGFQGRS